MVKREFVDRKRVIDVVIDKGTNWKDILNLLNTSTEIPIYTEQEIIEPYLEKLKEQVSHCNLCLLVNKEDVLGFIDNLLSESEG